MQIVIDIPEEVYKDAKEHMNCKWKSIIAIHNALNNCTVIPKGHDDLISRIEVLEKLHEYFDPLADGEDICPADIYHEINVLSKVIEADREVENEGSGV